MDKDLLYQQFLSNGGDASYEEFQALQSQFVIDSPDEELKKKDQPTENGIQNLTTSMSSSQTELPTLPNPIPENEFTVPMGSEQDLMSSSSDTAVPTPSTDLPLTDVDSSGIESLPTNQNVQGIEQQPTYTKPSVGAMAYPISNEEIGQYNDRVFQRNRTITGGIGDVAQNGKRATLTFEGTNENPIDILGGKNNDIQDEISTPQPFVADPLNVDNQSAEFINQYANKDYVNANPIVSKQPFNSWGVADNSETEDNLLLLESEGLIEIQRDADGTPIYEDNKYRYKITDKDYYDNTYTPYVENLQREAEKQAREQNVDSARFNFGNVGNNPEQDAFGEFMSQASKFGVIPTTEEYESLVSEESRNEYLATLEATQNAQKNKTTFQEEYDKVIGKYRLTDEVKFANGFDAVNLLNQGIENGKDKDKAEIDYFTNFFSDRNNVLDFGEYWEREGKAKYKSSLVRENQANYQQTRADIWNDYLNYNNDKLGVNQRFLEEAVATSSARAENYALQGNTVALEQEKAKMESLYRQYEANQNKMVALSNIFSDSNKNFTEVERRKKEQEYFQLKVEKGDFFDNAKNIAGQIPLGIGTSVNNLIGGGVRIANTILRSENLKDAADIIGETEIKVGNVKLDSRINQRIKYFKDQTTGVNYEERNGVLYGRNAKGELYKPQVQPDINNLKLEREETKVNGAGAVFGITKLLSDIALTRGFGKSLNYSSKLLNNSKNIASVFGVESQFAKIASSYAKVANSQKAETIAYWFTQTFNENYLAAEAAGITSEKGKEIYAAMMSGMIAGTSVISPDQNFLKVMNTNSRNIVASLLEGNIQKGALQASNLLKKLGVDVTNELKEEVPQQLLQDVGNIITNEIAGTTFQTSTKEDYKDVVDGTIITVGAISLFGSGASLRNSNRATINNEVIDLSIMPRSEVITKLAMDSRGLDYIRDYKESAIYPSLKNAAQKIEDEISTRKKYIDKIPDAEKYPTSALSEVTPILQELDRKREQLKKDDGTFAKTLNDEIETLTERVNSILSGETVSENQQQNNTIENAETPQSTPQSETVQEQTNTTENEPEQTAVQPAPQPIIPDGNGRAESGVEQVAAEQPTQNISPNDETNGITTDDGVFIPDDFLDLLNRIDNETTQTDNTATDGNAESGTEIIQQSEQSGQESPQSISTTPDIGASEGDAEVEDRFISKLGDRKPYQLINQKLVENNNNSNNVELVYEDVQSPKSISKYPELQLFSFKDKDGTFAIAENVYGSGKIVSGKKTLKEALDALEIIVQKKGVEGVSAQAKKAYDYYNRNYVQQNPTFSDNEQAQTLNENQYEINGRVYTQSPDGSFTAEDKNGKQRKVTNTKTVSELTNLAQERNTVQELEKNGYTYRKLKDGTETITSPKGKTISSKIQRRRNGKLRIENNPQFTNQKKKIFGEKSDNEIKIEDAQRRKEALQNFIPTSERELAMLYFANGGKISPASVSKEIAGNSEKLQARGKKRSIAEYKWVWLGKNATNTFESASERIVADEIQEFDQPTLRNELIDVAMSYGSSTEIAEEIVDLYNRSIDPYYGFTDEDAIAMQEAEASKAKMDFYNSVGDVYGLTDEELLDYYKQQYENSINNLTDEQQDQLYTADTRTDSAQQEDKNAGNGNSVSAKQSQEATSSPEYQQLLKDREAQEARVKSTKESLDRVSRNTNENFQADQENLFGERPQSEGMFDERADGNAGKEIIANAKREYDQAKADLAKTNKAIRDFESGNASGTGAIDFQSTDQQFIPIPQSTYDKLVKRLLGVFKRFGGKITTDWEQFKKQAGISDIELQFEDYRMSHRAPVGSDGFSAPIYNLTALYPEDVYSNQAGRHYGDGFWFDNESARILQSVRDKPDAVVTVYRAVPDENFDINKKIKALKNMLNYYNSMKFFDPSDENYRTYNHDYYYDSGRYTGANYENKFKEMAAEIQADIQQLENSKKKPLKINSGDWVTVNKEYAKIHGKSHLDGKYKIVSKKLKAKQIFTDANSINEQGVEFMYTKNGEVYGAKAPNGTIYLNPEKVNANTPIHEFSHLWQQLMPSRFKKGVELLKNTPIGKTTFAELKANEGYANKSDDELWNEALVTVMGNEGERIFNSSRASKFKEWLTDLFKALGNAFGIRDLSPNDKLSTFVKGALSEVMGTKEIIPESNVEQKEVPIYIKKMSNADLRTMLDRLGLVMDAVCP